MMVNPFIGQLGLVPYNFTPRGWIACEGQLLPIASNTTLFSLIGTTYGGDGRTTFALPDLRGRTPVSPGNGPGLDPIRWGETFGSQGVTLTTANLPTHDHPVAQSGDLKLGSSRGNTASGDGAYLASDTGADAIFNGAAAAGTSLAGPGDRQYDMVPTGGGQEVSTRSPFIGLRWAIATMGTYPPRP